MNPVAGDGHAISCHRPCSPGVSVRDSDVNLYRYDRLRAEFGPFVGEPGPDGTARAESDIVGDSYRSVLAETTAIVAHQWRNDISRSALKGYLFHGGVGIGKTTMGRRM